MKAGEMTAKSAALLFEGEAIPAHIFCDIESREKSGRNHESIVAVSIKKAKKLYENDQKRQKNEGKTIQF